VRATPSSDGQPRVGMGCLGSILGVVILVAIVVAVATVGLIGLAVLAAVVVVGLVVFAVDRLLLAISPKRRERRENLMRTWVRGSEIIDASATMDEQKPKPPIGEGDA
jgi:Na+/phosphate symporter